MAVKFFVAEDLLFNTDGPGDIGAASSQRPDNIYSKSGLGVGLSGSIDASAIAQFDSSSKALLIPRIANPAGDVVSPVAGLIGYDSTDNEFQYYDGTAWRQLAYLGAIDHGADLVGLGDDDHSQYFMVTGRNAEDLTITGANLLWSVDGGGDIGASGVNRPNNLYIKNDVNVGNDVFITGNLTVSGTTTQVDTTNMNVADKNIFINAGGTDLTSEGGGLTVDRVSTDGSLIYKDASLSKWACGALGSEADILNKDSSTSDLQEGSNLYFTDERAQDAIGAMVADTASIDVTYTDITPELKFDVLPAGVDHDQLLNFVADEHIAHTSVILTAGNGLSGGGDISASRQFDLDYNELVAAPVVSGDLISFGDVSDSNTIKKIVFSDFVGDIELLIDHGLIQGLGDDDHSQYALLAGRSGGQTLKGDADASGNLVLESTANVTKGEVQIASGSDFNIVSGSFDMDNFHMKEYALQTTDATASTLADIALADDTSYVVEAIVSARVSTGVADRMIFKKLIGVYREAAGGATIMSPGESTLYESAGSWLCSFDVNLNNLRLRITGEAAKNIEWKAVVKLEKVSIV